MVDVVTMLQAAALLECVLDNAISLIPKLNASLRVAATIHLLLNLRVDVGLEIRAFPSPSEAGRALSLLLIYIFEIRVAALSVSAGILRRVESFVCFLRERISQHSAMNFGALRTRRNYSRKCEVAVM